MHSKIVILYIHGFGSRFDPQSDKVKALSYLGEVKGITVDYTSMPSLIEKQLMNACTDFQVDLIVGTSLGGYWANRIGAQIGVPFVSINPAISPNVTLQKYIGFGQTYYGENYELTPEAVDAYTDFSAQGCGLILLDMADELLDSVATNSQLKDQFKVHCFEGGTHRFSHMNEAIPIIERFVSNAALIYGVVNETDINH
ncbi:UPF0227 protein [Shewanella algicola]|uniref:Esterase n=1 Tax=Shewanella algicola TaxID=640633 RepID=A0A9X1Z3W2_9GAMM|nr:YqiA/YcfP family alpha/beta fold hydrolase [Shewanella algicola]MCL1105306.1 hypothetical protein [Shewanella algicola]GGP50675.1 UPF0227 protein [Shewanella algicola]